MLLQCLKLMTETKCENRTSLLKIISCLLYPARQGLPLRRHGEEKDANFKQLIRFRAEGDPAFAKWLKEKNLNYTSPEIQNEILKDMNWSILRDVVNCIKKPDFFSIMVDKSSDVSNREQVVFCVRRVDDFNSHEGFIAAYTKWKRQMQQRWSMLSKTLFWGFA